MRIDDPNNEALFLLLVILIAWLHTQEFPPAWLLID